MKLLVFSIKGVGLVLLMAACAASTRADDWLTGWGYRADVDITGSTAALTGYQVLVTVDTASLISDGKLRADCGDLRFTDTDGASLLDYWVESGCNTASTQVWVKVPSIPTGGTTIYMYYGNPSASSASNGTNTFEFFDDFESGTLDADRWATGGTGGTIAIENGELKIGCPSTNRTGVRSTSQIQAPFILDWGMSFSTANPGDRWNYMFISPSVSEDPSGHSNWIRAYAWDHCGAGEGWAFHKKVSGSVTTLWSQSGYLGGITPYKLILDVNKYMEFYYNNTLRYSGIQSDLTFTNGYIYLYVYASNGGSPRYSHYDNIRARKYASPEPATSAGAEEEEPIVDCNSNGIPDYRDIAEGTSSDFDSNGIPDECEQPAGELLLVVAPGSECVTSVDQVIVTLDVANLTHAINGVQALIHYDISHLAPVSITPAIGWVLIVPDGANPDPNSDGDFTCALYLPGDEMSADGTVATLVFAPVAEGATQAIFQDDDDPFYTKLTRASDNTTIFPDKVDSGTISIDNTIATAGSSSPVCEGGTIDLYGGPDTGSNGPYTYAWVGTNGFSSTEQNPTISDATLDMNGTYTLTVTNGSGCEFVAQTVVEVYLCMVVNVEIEGLIGDSGIYGSPSSGTELDREVTFVFTDCDGDTDAYTVPITFTAQTGENKGVGSATFTGLDAGFEWLSVQEGHTLRELVAVDFMTTLADSVTVFLPSGDFHTAVVPQDNMVDITDFSILASNWETPIGADQGIGGDATGDGYHDADDFALIQPNFLTFGEGINGCGKLLSHVGRVPPAASEDGVISRTPRTSIDVSELRLRVPDARRADLDGNGVVDARDIRKFAKRHNLSLQPAFDAKLAELEELLVPSLESAAELGFERTPHRRR